MTQQTDLQKLALELRLLQERAAQLERQLTTFRALREESRSASKALEAIPSSKESVLFPVGAGVLVKAQPSNSGKVFFEIGSGVVMEKPVEEVVKVLEGRAEKLSQALESIQKEFEQVAERIEELRALLLEAQRGK